ncbi:MAG: M1 family aminopeptidase [Bryobacteraceae bacterium]
MRRLFLFGLLASRLVSAQSHVATDLGRAVLTAGFDLTTCYHVHDIEISQEDAQFYLTDGYIMFGKPVKGAPVAAVFSAEVEGGDAEVLLLPPNRSERKALSSYTNSPNLDEHFKNAIFFFTEAQARGLADRIRTTGGATPSPEIAALLSDQWSTILANLTGSFESRIVLDLLDDASAEKGFFTAIIQGRKLGNFDVGYDARSYEQLHAGQINTRDGKTYMDTWTSFAVRSRRNLPPPAPEVEILGYRIEASLDESLALQCITRIRIRATGDSRHAIPFDLSAQMRATTATIDGVPAEVYWRESADNEFARNSSNELLLVVPPQPLEPGSEHEIEIRHEGNVVLDANRQVSFITSRGAWYPMRGSQFATYDVTWRYPKTLDLVSAGQVKEDRTEGNVRITRRVPDGRIDALAFNLGRYDSKVVERDGVQIAVNADGEVGDALGARQPDFQPVRPDGLSSTRRRGQRPLANAPIDLAIGATPETSGIAPAINSGNQLSELGGQIAAAVDFYRARFGDPPVTRIEVSPLPGRVGQGFAGMIYLPTLSYLPANVRPLSLMPAWQQVFYSEFVRAHEAAHQWWGNIVTASGYHHEWLMEALANYSALMFLESRNGPKFVDNILDEYRRQLLAKGPDGETAESEGPVVQGRRLESSNNPNAWGAVAYGKGTWIMHMLRRRLGDAQFTKMLAELRRRYEWKSIDTEQFRLLCAEFLPKGSSDPKLENFFDQWVYGTGLPALKLTWSVQGMNLTGTVTQSEVPDDFTVTVPVEIQTGHGKVVRDVQTSSEPVSFSVPVTAANARAVLDPGSSVLRR